MIKIHSKTHQIASFQKYSRGSMPPNPPSNAHGFATCKFPNLKKISWPPPPPLPNPGDAPTLYIIYVIVLAILHINILILLVVMHLLVSK